MTAQYNDRTLNQMPEDKNQVLFFPKDISTKEGLDIIKKHHFKCGYRYTFQVDGQTFIRAIFYNHKYDILSIFFTNQQFYLQSELNRLYLNRQEKMDNGDTRAKHFIPINPFNQYSHTKSVLPHNVDTIDIDNLDDLLGYELRLVPENYIVEKNKRKKLQQIHEEANGDNSLESNALEHLNNVALLANYYNFDKTHEQLDATLKKLYGPLLKKHQQVFYVKLLSLAEYLDIEEVIDELEELLEGQLDRLAILDQVSEITRKKNDVFSEIVLFIKKIYIETKSPNCPIKIVGNSNQPRVKRRVLKLGIQK